METSGIRRWIKWLSLVWALVAIVLFVCVWSRVMTMDQFQWIFVAGFIAYAVVVTLLSQVATETDSDCRDRDHETDV